MIWSPGFAEVLLQFFWCWDEFRFLAHRDTRAFRLLHSVPDGVDALEVLLKLALDSPSEFPSIGHRLPDGAEHRVGEVATPVTLQHDGFSLGVGQGALLRPSPTHSSMSVTWIERADFPNTVTSHLTWCSLPSKLESPSDYTHRRGLPQVVLLMLELSGCSSMSEQDSLVLEALGSSGTSLLEAFLLRFTLLRFALFWHAPRQLG